MNKFTKIACAAIVASMLLFACNINEDNEPSSSIAQSSSSFENKDTLPVMDSGVVSYKMIYPIAEKEEIFEYLKYGDGFIFDQDILKSLFPDIFNNEQAKSNCNYFAMYFGSSSTLIRYWILSKDMILYKINPGYGRCFVTAYITHHVMLVCDDTEDRNLKDKINLDNIQPFTDENWDCREDGKWEDVFF